MYLILTSTSLNGKRMGPEGGREQLEVSLELTEVFQAEVHAI